jgi:hypothetical protein
LERARPKAIIVPVNTQRALCLLLAAATTFACNGEEEPDPACLDHIGNLVVPQASDLPLQGKVTLFDRDTRTLGDDGLPQDLQQGRIQAAFFDVSARTATEAAFMQLSDECVGRVSRGLPAEGLVPLSIAMLEVRGTARGAVQAGQVGDGLYLNTGNPILGTDPLQVLAQAGEFPAFDETIIAPDPIMLSSPPLDGSTLVDIQDLTVDWNAGNGEFVIIAIDPDITNGAESGGDVVCILPDDGCQTLPKSVSVFLLASQSPTFTIIVSRHRYRAVTIDQQTFLEIEAYSEVRGTLKSGVVQ